MKPLEQDGLTSLDEFGSRILPIPADVVGRFRSARTKVYSALIILFLVLPWTKVNGIQTLLLNIPDRKFAIFGVMFWAHDAPLLFFVFLTVALSLAFATAVWGRIWCGWACPQTVFIDTVFRRIETLVEGNYIARRKKRDAPLSLKGAAQSVLKWSLFLIVATVIAHSLLAYFVGAERLLALIQGRPQDNWSVFVLVLILTGITAFNFGWFREQFCIIMCPYGKFQSVLMDDQSITVTYDEKRGEPRKGSVAALTGAAGDCVACNRCVQVCPTGIDIRKGVQLECIACTACVDACDEIMTKVNKPKNLIRYAAVNGGRRARLFKPRALVYLTLIFSSVGAVAYNYFGRQPYSIILMRAKDSPYQVIKMNEQTLVSNHFKLHLHNQTLSDQVFTIDPDSERWRQDGLQMTLQDRLVQVPAGGEKTLHFFILYPETLLQQKQNLVYDVKAQMQSQTAQPAQLLKFELVGPSLL